MILVIKVFFKIVKMKSEYRVRFRNQFQQNTTSKLQLRDYLLIRWLFRAQPVLPQIKLVQKKKRKRTDLRTAGFVEEYAILKNWDKNTFINNYVDYTITVAKSIDTESKK